MSDTIQTSSEVMRTPQTDDVRLHPNPEPRFRPDARSCRPVDVLCLSGATILTVWAHPDDESYLGGGLIAAAAAGCRVVNVTATLGEHGTPDPVATPPDRLASIRRDELDDALRALGVSESVVLGYEDGALEAVEPEVGARRITTVLEEVDPDLVVSFGPDGFTGHPDHIAIGAWPFCRQQSVAACPRI